MKLPQVPSTFNTERAGVLSVALELNRLGIIWRETPMADIGIDGQIEFVATDGAAVGQLMAVQAKTGESQFHDHGNEWRFYPEEKHRFYWERFPMPVLLMLHSPQAGLTYWVDARQFLRDPATSSLRYVAIPKANRLPESTREELFFSMIAGSQPMLSLERVLSVLVSTQTSNASFPLSYLDLFANGLTNIARSLYFSMDLASTIAEFHFEMNLDPELRDVIGMSLGGDEYEFLFDYVQFIVQQHIADVDFSDFLIDWYSREMVPRFIAPLTSRGRELVRLIGELQDSLSDELEAPRDPRRSRRPRADGFYPISLRSAAAN
jgi:hypothetical protein